MTTEAAPYYLPPGLPAPAITELDRAFWEGARDGKLLVQACAACDTVQWPPEEICGACHSTNRTWRQASGRGTVFSWSRIWHPVHPALHGHAPYIALVVRLDDFPVLMIGNLLGDPAQEVVIGSPVCADFEDHGHYGLVQWRAG